VKEESLEFTEAKNGRKEGRKFNLYIRGSRRPGKPRKPLA
jgi:hypothetical protein